MKALRLSGAAALGAAVCLLAGVPLAGQVVTEQIPISTNAQYFIAVNPVLNKIYVSGGASGGQVVQAINGSTYALTTFGTGSGASVDTTTGNVWAAGVYGGDALVYSGSTGSLIQTVTLGDCPIATAYDSTAGRAWAGAQCGGGNDPTYAINGSTYAVEAGPIGSGATYSRVIVNPVTGRAYVETSGNSLRIDPNNSFTQTTNAFGFVGAVDATNNLLFAIPSGGTSLQIINGEPATEVVLQTVTLPFSASAASMAVNPTTGRLYLSNTSGNSIAVENEQTGASLESIALGTGNTPTALAVDPTRSILYAIVQTSSGPQVWVIPDAPAATPTFDPTAGTYTTVQSVTILDATPNSTIYYTTDGNSPTTLSTQYLSGISVSASQTIKAIATATNYLTSAVASAAYTINLPTAATPTFDPPAGAYTFVQSVAISDTTPGATVYYTTDGTTPTTSSTVYAGAINVGTSETIKAIAVANNYLTSAVASAAYTINLPPPSVGNTIPISTNAQYFIAVNPVLNKIYVSGGASGGQVVQAIDGSTYALTTLGTGSGASVDTTTGNVWAAGVYGGDALVYSGSTGSLIQTVTLGDCPIATAYDSTAGRAWAGAQCGGGNDPTYAINGSTYAVEAGPIGSGATYSRVIVNPVTGRAYVETSGNSLRIDPNNSFTQTTNAFGFVGAVDATNNLLFAIPSGGTSLQIINGHPATEVVLQTVTLPFSASAASMAVNPTTGRLYLSNTSGNSIAVQDEQTGASLESIALGTGNTPSALAVDLTRSILYAIVQTSSGPQVWIIPDGAQPAAMPTFNPAAGTYNSVQSVTILDATPNSTIYYTTDGNSPTTFSTRYLSPISVSASQPIKAIAAAADDSPSAVSTANYTIEVPAALTSPAAGSVLTGPSERFAWTAPSGATEYIFRLGTTAGAKDVYTSGVTTATSVTPTNLPTNGETIYATLYTYYGSAQVSNSYTFTATAPAALSAPASGSVLTGPSVTFNWTAATGPGVTGYIFQLGTTAGGNNVYSSGMTTATSVTRTNLPTNGETIYATLKTNYGSVQLTNSYTFTAANTAALTSPTGGTLSGTSVTFSWTTATGAGVTGYKFWLGTTAGTNNIYASGPITATSATPTNLPTNGETIYATLNTYYGSATVSNSYTFTAANKAALASPTGGSTLSGPGVTFNWTAATGAGVTGYIFQMGTTAGGNNVYSSGVTTATSVTRTNLPTNGETIYATLYTRYGSVQVTNSYTFTAANKAALTSPTGGTLSGTSVTFSWMPATGAGVTGYRFWLGTTAGTNNIYASGPITATSATANKLPTNGETIYATLYTYYGSATVSNSYTFTAYTP